MDLNALLGKVFDERYEVLSVAGAGGMGTVFKARQIGLERFVALKILSPELLGDDESVKRFEREARAISQLKHVNIAAFYSFGCSGSLPPYIVMEYLEGESLRALLGREEKLDWQRALHIIKQICQAMASAHAAGLVHRDLKPNNIMLLSSPDKDFVKIVDFGLAKLTLAGENNHQKLTRTGELVGSVQYLSPEQCQGRAADARSDIYALACVMYEMLTGLLPFEADNPIGIIHKHMNEEPLPASKRAGRSLAEGLDEIIAKAMSKDAARRYQSMQELEADLSFIEQGQGSRIRKEIGAGKGKRWSKRAVLLAVAAALALPLALLVGFSWLYSSEAFSSFWAQKCLAARPDRKTILYWFNVYDKWSEAGQTSAAEQLLNRLKQALAVRADGTSIETIYLNLGQDNLAQGNKKAAGRWASRAFTELALTGGTREEKLKSITGDWDEKMTLATRLMLDCNVVLSKAQFVQIHSCLERNFGKARVNILLLEYEATLHYKIVPTSRLVGDMVEMEERLGSGGQVAKMEALLPEVLAAAKKQFGPGSEPVSHLYTVAAREFARTGHFKKAMVYLKTGMNILESKPDELNLQRCHDLMAAASAYKSMGMLQDSIACLKLAESVACIKGQSCEACAYACVEHAVMDLDSKDWNEAHELAKRSLANREKIEIQDFHVLTRSAEVALAALWAMGKREQANSEMQEFIRFLEQKQITATDLQVILLRLTDLFVAHKDFTDANKYYGKVLQLAGRNQPSDVQKQFALMNLLYISLAEMKFEDAAKLLVQLRQVPHSAVLQADSSKLAACIFNIYGSLKQNGKGKIYEQTIDWLLQLCRGDSNSLAQWRLNGFIAGQLDRLGECSRLVPIVTELAAKCSPQSEAYISAMAVQSFVLSKTSSLSLAEKVIAPLLSDSELRHREITAEYLTLACDYASLLNNSKRYHEAERILFVLESRLDSQPLLRAHLCTYLGQVLFDDGRIAEAEALARREIELAASQSLVEIQFRTLLIQCLLLQKKTREAGQQALLVAELVNDDSYGADFAGLQIPLLESVSKQVLACGDRETSKLIISRVITFLDKHKGQNLEALKAQAQSILEQLNSKSGKTSTK